MSSGVRLWAHHSQYIFLGAILAFDIAVIQSPPLWVRLMLALILPLSQWIPYVRRFTLPCLPIFTWLITFYACQFIPESLRPQHIFVNVLPTLEHILYGANLSEMISRHTHPILDVLAWLPYGIIHFTFPFIISLLLFIYGPPRLLKCFAKAFGYMNLAGVITQLMFPCASPWYELSYGSAPATYAVPGQPGGLARIDSLLGLRLYSTTFGNSPLVFGAFPSLHSGCATLEMMFLSYLFPKLRPLCVVYVIWMWWATMYLTHHYLIDLVGGSIYATLTFTIYWNTLPQLKQGARTRLDYFELNMIGCLGSFLATIEMPVSRHWHERHEDKDPYHTVVDLQEEEKHDSSTMEHELKVMPPRLQHLDMSCLGAHLSSRPGSLTSCSPSSSLSGPSSPQSISSLDYLITRSKDQG